MRTLSLRALIAILSFGLFREIHLIVDGVVVVPVILAIHAVLDTEIHRLVLEFCLVFELDTESEEITAMNCLLFAHIIDVLCYDFRSRFPVVKSEACNDQLVESEITHYHVSFQNLSIR